MSTFATISSVISIMRPSPLPDLATSSQPKAPPSKINPSRWQLNNKKRLSKILKWWWLMQSNLLKMCFRMLLLPQNFLILNLPISKKEMIPSYPSILPSTSLGSARHLLIQLLQHLQTSLQLIWRLKQVHQRAERYDLTSKVVQESFALPEAQVDVEMFLELAE